MRYAVVIAGAALAPLASAAVHRDQHGRVHAHNHAKKDVITEVEYVTVWATGPVEHASTAVSSTTTSTPSKVYSSSTSSSSSTKVAPSHYTSTSAAAVPDSTGISKSDLSPNGKKAGLSGYIGISSTEAFADLAPYISWYSDYTATTPAYDGVVSIPMLWGADGSPCGDFVTDRLNGFESTVANSTPPIMFGFYEPDCSCDMSSEMSVSDAATQWDDLIAPLADRGTILGSPSMCKQKDEDFLTPFNASISTTWDVTSIHVNKPDLAGVMADVEYYVSTYNKPVWVSEFACVYDQDNFTPCSDQSTINDFINQTVYYLENNPNVVAYGASNGAGLGNVWPLTTQSADGQNTILSDTGNYYLSVLQGL